MYPYDFRRQASLYAGRSRLFLDYTRDLKAVFHINVYFQYTSRYNFNLNWKSNNKKRSILYLQFCT